MGCVRIALFDDEAQEVLAEGCVLLDVDAAFPRLVVVFFPSLVEAFFPSPVEAFFPASFNAFFCSAISVRP